MSAEPLVNVQLGRGVYLPPGNAPHPEGDIVTLPQGLANALVAAGNATLVAAPGATTVSQGPAKPAGT